jgi:hypothetical protein
MVWTRLNDHRVARRITVVNGFEFPASVRQRFGWQHPELDADQIRVVETATRQWFRLVAGHRKAKLSMPSTVVDALWHELVLHTREYAAFCQAAFGRFLHHQPESAMSGEAAAANRTTRLLATLDLARRDEGCGAKELPLLFRVDQDLDVPGGRRYLADCGGRGECYEVPGMVCLQHLVGFGKQPGAWGPRRAQPPSGMFGGQIGGCGGCGG